MGDPQAYFDSYGSHAVRPGWMYSRRNKKWIYCRSQLEWAWCQIFETSKAVHRYYVPSVEIRYEWEGRLERYRPDFRVRYKDGTTVLVEVKPEAMWKVPQNTAKWNAAREWCEYRGVETTFRVLGYRRLWELGGTTGRHTDHRLEALRKRKDKA